METVLLHKSAFLYVTSIFRLSSFVFANALLTGITKTFVPFYSSFPEILFKFYTYTKDDLTISLSGELQKAEYSVSQMGTLDNAMFVNDKDLALVKKINKGDVEDGEVLTFAGGGGWGNAATGVLLCNQDAWTAVDEEITGEPVLEGEPKAYSSGSVTLKPEGGFQVGNMYEASALIQSVPATGSLNIVIENIQSGGEINFGFN